MISLFIDTCTSNLLIALFRDKTLLKKVIKKNDSNLSTVFTSTVDNLLNNANININDVEKVYVAVGPGSFTGVRIGLTFAKVLAWSKNIPIVPISSLEVLATGYNNEFLVPILNARRGYVYAGIYDRDLKPVMDDAYILLDDLKDKLINYQDYVFISCDEFEIPVSSTIYRIEDIIKKHFNDPGVNPHSLVPHYIKKTEAEEKLEAK